MFRSRLELAVDSRSGEQSLRRFRGELDQTERRGSSAFGNLRSLALGFAGVLGTIGATRFFRTMLGEQQEVERNLLRTTQLLESTGAAAWTTADALDAQARGLARATLQSTAGVQRAQQVLLTFRNVTEDTFDRSIELAADLATVMGGDITSAAQQLGRALEDPVRGITALRRSGVSFTDAQQELIKSLVETNRASEAQALILDELAGQLGGVAKREAEGLAGAFDTLGQANAEAREALAEYFDLAQRSTTTINTLAGVVDNFTQRLASGDLDGIIRGVTTSFQVLAALAAGRLAVSLGTASAAFATKTAAMIAANGAAVTLTRSLALLGGPFGVLIAAGTAAYLFRDSINSTSRAANRAKQEIDNLTASINLNSEASIRSGIAELERKLVEVQAEAAQASAELDQARLEMTDQAADAARGAGQAYNQAKAQADEYRGAISGLKGELEQLAAQEDRLAEVRALGITATDGLDDSTRELTTSVGSLAAGTSNATREIDEMRRAFESLMNRLFPLEAQQRRYREEQLLLTQAWNEGAISADRYTEAMRRLEQAQLSQQTPGQAYGGMGFGSQIGDPMSGMGAMGEAGYWDQWLESARTALTDFDQLAANTAESFQRGFGNAFESMIMDSNSLRDAAHQLFDGMARTMINALGQMAAQWISYQAVQMATGRSAEAAAIAGATATGAAIASAYAPAAAAASLASFGGNSGPAMAGISATHSLSQTMALSGMAHDGIDRVPKEGTWLLDKGERVVRRDQADKLDAFLDRQGGGGESSVNVKNVNVFDSADVLDQAMADTAGQKVMLNYIKSNRSAVRGALGV